MYVAAQTAIACAYRVLRLGYATGAGGLLVANGEQLGQDLGASHSSLLQTFRHIHDGERVWLRRLVEVDNDRLPCGAAPEQSFEFLIQTWPEL
jgi:hypothetical protein